jgi:hypothetical protein
MYLAIIDRTQLCGHGGVDGSGGLELGAHPAQGPPESQKSSSRPRAEQEDEKTKTTRMRRKRANRGGG